MVFAQNDFVRGVFLNDNVSVKFKQLHDSLNINWVQAAVDSYSGGKFNQVLRNSANLNVIGISHGRWSNVGILEISSAQHMVYKAAIAPPTTENYFDVRNGSIVDDTLRQSPGSAGFMVTTLVPDNEWGYGRTHYYASFALKRAPGFPDTRSSPCR
jgi:hypothetical protein